MLKSKIKKCQLKLAKCNDSITKFTEEHEIDEITIYRNILTYYNKLKDCDKDSYLSSKNVSLDTCKNANRLFIKYDRLKKRRKINLNKSYTISHQLITHHQHPSLQFSFLQILHFHKIMLLPKTDQFKVMIVNHI